MENSILQRLNAHVEARANAQKEIERFQEEIARLQENIKKAKAFIKEKDTEIDKIMKVLDGE